MRLNWKMWWESRTIIFSVLLAVFGAIESNENLRMISHDWYPLVMLVIAAIVAALRAMTTGSLHFAAPPMPKRSPAPKLKGPS